MLIVFHLFTEHLHLFIHLGAGRHILHHGVQMLSTPTKEETKSIYFFSLLIIHCIIHCCFINEPCRIVRDLTALPGAQLPRGFSSPAPVGAAGSFLRVGSQSPLGSEETFPRACRLAERLGRWTLLSKLHSISEFRL